MISDILKRLQIPFLILLILVGNFWLGYEVGRGKPAARVENVSSSQTAPAGTVTGEEKEPPAFLSKDVDFALFWDVWKRVKDLYVDQPVNDVQLFYGALKGMTQSLEDPYTVFFDPQMAEEFHREIQGTFEGIGAEIGIKKDRLLIIAPLAGTPAEQAGIQAGDHIVLIDKEDTAGMPLDVAVSKIRGKKGTTVVLTIFRKNFDEPKDIPIVRNTIRIQGAKWDMVQLNNGAIERGAGDIALLKLSHFNGETLQEFFDAARAITLKNPKALIVDLRNNPGGLLDISVEITGAWVPGDIVVTERFTDGRRREYRGQRRNTALTTMKTVVLVNEGSASASEILAGALQDYKKATIIGGKTFGKGSVQEIESFRDGSALKVTVAKWLTPKDRSITDEGIEPDIVISMDTDDFENDRDPQLNAAIRFLNGEKVESEKQESTKAQKQ